MPSLPFLSHEQNWNTLQTLLNTARLPHALLFTGPEGIGKQSVAKHLARAILCQSDSEPNPCGACQACHLSQSNESETETQQKHPDFQWVEPENGKIKIDTIREIKKGFEFAPFMGKHRVIVINDTHSMNTAAANALLKSLEEPPEGTFFILITHALGWVPRTIVSRCQQTRFSPLSSEQLKQILDKLEIPHSSQLLHWAQGSVQKALKLHQAQGLLPSLESLTGESKAITFSQAYDLSQQVLEEDKLKEFLTGLLALIHYHLTTNQNNSNHFHLLNFINRILEIQSRLRQNINAKLYLTRLLLYFQEPMESRL